MMVIDSKGLARIQQDCADDIVAYTLALVWQSQKIAKSAMGRLAAVHDDINKKMRWGYPIPDGAEPPVMIDAGAKERLVLDLVNIRGQAITIEYNRLREWLMEQAPVDYQVMEYATREFPKMEITEAEEERTFPLSETHVDWRDFARKAHVFRAPGEAEVVKAIMAPALWDGKSILDRFDDLGEIERRAISSSIATSLREGEDMARASRRLRGVTNTTGRRASTIARTEIMRVSDEMRFSFYDSSKNVIQGLQFMATLDERTCEVCAMFDGIEYFYEHPPLIMDMPHPPIHPLCRCTTVPISRFWEILGVPPRPGTPGGYRAGTGIRVSMDTNFGTWLRRMEEKQSGYGRRIIRSKARYEEWLGGADLTDIEGIKRMAVNMGALPVS